VRQYRVQFYLDENEMRFFSAYAKAKGLDASSLAKMATFQYVARYPLPETEMMKYITFGQKS